MRELALAQGPVSSLDSSPLSPLSAEVVGCCRLAPRTRTMRVRAAGPIGAQCKETVRYGAWALDVDEGIVDCAFPVLVVMESVEHMIGELMLIELSNQIRSKRASDLDDVQYA